MLDRPVSWVFAAAFATAACRYSNSETPPPLEPDFEQLQAERSRASAEAVTSASWARAEGENGNPPAAEGEGADSPAVPGAESAAGAR